MSLLGISFNDTRDLPITHPTTGLVLEDKDGNPVTATIYGAQSKKYRDYINKRVNKNLKRGKKRVTAEESTQDSLALLAACTKSLNNFGKDDVSDITAVFSDIDNSWLVKQIDDGVHDEEGFLA